MKNPSPTISVTMTTYNHEKYIGDAIQSCLTQSFEDFELVIVNDGSTDQTDEIIRKFNDDRIIYISQNNQGPSAAFNRAILASKGKYLVCFDGDDICYPNRLERQYEFISQSNSEVIFSQVDFIDDDGELIVDKEDGDEPFDFTNRTRAQMLEYFFDHGNYFCSSTVMAERKVFLEAGLFCLTSIQLQDFDMWIKLFKKYELFILPEKLVKYRIRSNKANLSFNPDYDQRGSFEIYHISKNAFNDMPIELFRDAFKARLKKADFKDGNEYELEKAFLCLSSQRSEIQSVGLGKLFNLLQDKDVLSIAIKEYGFDLSNFYKMTLFSQVPGISKEENQLIAQ